MMKRVLLYLIDRYQRTGGSRQLLVECNFEPTCSEYAKQAVTRYGTIKGLRLTGIRLARCCDRDKVLAEFDPVP